MSTRRPASAACSSGNRGPPSEADNAAVGPTWKSSAEPFGSAEWPSAPRESQNPTTPEIMKPLNWPPFRMSVTGKSLYFWFTYSSFASTFGVTNQPPPS
jgi:hypothetical protein